MKGTRKGLLYLGLAVGGLLVVFGALSGWLSWKTHLPSERTAREQFADHRADYVRFASLLAEDPQATFIDRDGRVGRDITHRRVVPQYRDLMRKIGAQSVLVREDGSVEFAVWGFGCAICSDSYMGVRYLPAHHDPGPHPGWTAKLVESVDEKNLPHEGGSVLDGLYVAKVEPEWFIYRLEIHE